MNVGRDNMRFLITDLQNNIIKEENDFTGSNSSTARSASNGICSNIENFIANCGIDRAKILGLGVCMTGRVNPATGRSYKYFTSSEQSLRHPRRAGRHPRAAGERHPGPLLRAEYTCGKSEGRKATSSTCTWAAVWPSASWSTDNLYYGKAASRAKFNPYSVLRQRDHLFVRQEGVSGDRGFGYRHRGQDDAT